MSQTTLALRWGGTALVGLGVVLLLLLVLLDPTSGPRREWTRYVRKLEYEARFLRLTSPGAHIAYAQLVVALGLVIGLLWTGDLRLVFGLLLVVVVPYFVLRRRHMKRVGRIEDQLDGWLVIVANALRAAPSLGDAIGSSAALVAPPLAEEIDETIKEMRFGTPVDRAVLDLGARIGSRTVQGALAALLVGRQAGGELSATLEETAASIREMTRLEGVLRAKTSEGRMQAYVLASIPFFLLAAIQWIDPNWLAPLTQTPMGILLTAVSAGLWLSAILMARRILAVDL